MKLEIFDSTLRDGAQSEGISFSVQDKLDIVQALYQLDDIVSEAETPAPTPRTSNSSAGSRACG